MFAQVGSTTIGLLNYGPVAQPGVKYTVIETYYEDVITPAGSSFILEPGVNNIWLQAYCPYSFSTHPWLSYDRGVMSLVGNALDPTHPSKVSC